jgi:hypothetical protein
MVLPHNLQDEQEIYYDYLGDNLTMWQAMFLNVWLYFTNLKKFCEFILNLINSWLLESLDRVEKGSSIGSLELGSSNKT